ncbi:hypothetical protein CP533_2050 [Ophiocordyceps camponoti-saundersi (nom. inval.)]|nr:hypothetical protein CP533_2050 [Ophiocordyceps camponoti-saundersi (nom. inval.)]
MKATTIIRGLAAGSVTFTQQGDQVHVSGIISGLSPGLHGFHIHEKNDLSQNCTKTGFHFNPFKQTHGAPNNTVRHVGDLGNIEADRDGVAHVSINDSLISLTDPTRKILNLAVVVHSGEDDYGRGGQQDSLITGHSHERIACGLITADGSGGHDRDHDQKQDGQGKESGEGQGSGGEER